MYFILKLKIFLYNNVFAQKLIRFTTNEIYFESKPGTNSGHWSPFIILSSKIYGYGFTLLFFKNIFKTVMQRGPD